MKRKLSVIAVSLFFFCSLTEAQWVQTNLPNFRVHTIVANNNNLFAGTNGNGIYISTNSGSNWSAVNNGLTNTFIRSLKVIGTNIFAGTYGGGVFRSTDNGASWNTANNGVTNSYVLGFADNSPNIFACAEAAGGNVFLSTNNGSNWSLANNGIPSTTVHAITFSNTNFFVGTNGVGIYTSTNNGLNWSQVNNGLTNTYIHAIAGSGTNMFAGSEGGIVYVSTNNGSNWSGINVGSAASTFQTFAFSSTNIFAGAWGGGVFLSTDNGLSWNAINSGLTDTDVLSLAVKGDTLFAGTFSSGVWKRPLSEIVPVELVSFIADVNEHNVILNWKTATETNNSGFEIFRFTQNNDGWKMVGFVPGFGTTSESKNYSFIDENLSAAKYQYKLKQIDFDGTFNYSNVIEVEILSPEKFSLGQNYPNPFSAKGGSGGNPGTIISWQSPVAGLQTLKVYDVLGNEVATLVDEYREAGSYQVDFNPAKLSAGRQGLSTGVYYYRLTIGSFSESKKMIYIK